MAKLYPQGRPPEAKIAPDGVGMENDNTDDKMPRGPGYWDDYVEETINFDVSLGFAHIIATTFGVEEEFIEKVEDDDELAEEAALPYMDPVDGEDPDDEIDKLLETFGVLGDDAMG